MDNRSVSAQMCVRLIVAVLAASAFTGTVSKASATPVEYQYTGGYFTSVSGVYTTADQVTGTIVLPSPLAPSSPNYLNTPDAFSSFSFSDGVNTITNSNVSGPYFGGAFTTNAANEIVHWNFEFSTVRGSAPYGAVIGSIGDDPSQFGDESFGGDSLPATLGDGYNFTPGTWSGPMAVPPPPSQASLYLTVIPVIPLSKSNEPTGITAMLTLADSPPSPDAIQLSSLLIGSNDTTLQQAANDLGYVGFDWQQTLRGPSPLPFYMCGDPSCDPLLSREVVGSTKDPAQPYGFDYCNPSLTNPFYIQGASTPCVHIDVYDPTIAAVPATSANLCIRTSGGVCETTLTNSADTVLNFYDAPQDPCLVDQSGGPTSGQPSLAYQTNPSAYPGGPTVQSRCNNMTTTGQLSFVTDLEGILPNGSTVALAPIDFTWTDTFNGLLLLGPNGGFTPGMGGISTPGTDLSVDPESGTGGIIVTEIVGQPVSPVPEPPGTALFFSGIALLYLHRKHMLYKPNASDPLLQRKP